jgi:phage tail sheath protein FI
MPEQRAKARFSFQQPVLMKVRGEAGWTELQGITENASTVGVFLTTYSPVTVGSDVDLTVAMPHDVRVSCSGRVIRVEPRTEEGKIGVAVQCATPFNELPIAR